MIKYSEILVPTGTRKHIGEVFSCSQPFVRNVLAGRSQKDKRFLKIRKFALDNGGAEKRS
jgi:hypothetical protein